MSLHDVYRAFRDLYHQVRDSLRQVRTANTQIPGTWPNGTEPNPNNHAAGASSPSRKRLPSPPSTLQSDALQSLPSQYHSQQTHTGGNGPPAVASHLDPGNFWGDLVILPSPPSPFAGQWQASHSLALLVDAIYHWAESTLPPFNEGGLSPQKVGLLLSMGEYANEHNIYALCEQNATIMSFGSRWLKEKLINQGMREFYNLYDLSYNIHNVPPQAQSFFNHSTFSTPPPLLTRQGHLRFVLIGILIDPYTNFVNINKFLSKIPPLINPMTGGNLPSSIPRYAFPATEDSNTKQYVDGIRQRMATMAFAGASINLQQGGIALDLAGSLHGGGYGSTSTGTWYNGSMIGAGI